MKKMLILLYGVLVFQGSVWADAKCDAGDPYTQECHAQGLSPCWDMTAHPSGKHYHNYDFQMMFVLKGWVKMYYEGEGENTLKEGDFVYHPKGHVHDFMEYSKDIEILEMASPAHHHSIDV